MKQENDQINNPHNIQEFTTEYASHILGIGTDEFSGEKYKKIDDDEQKIMNKTMDNYLLVRSLIREKYPKGTEFVQDSIPCLICKGGKISFTIADHYNGHIHAGCSNGCVSWME